MPTTARLRYLRIAPRKVRLVVDIIRGKSVEKAQNILSFTTKKAARPILKLLKSASASAINNFQASESNLYISQIFVDEGPKYKRWRARARGRAAEIQKKTSHITIILEEIDKRAPKVKDKKVKKVKQISKEKKIREKKDEAEKPKEGEKPKFKPKLEIKRPKASRGLKRIFRRKAF